jgi:hypothetical protein
MLLLKNNGPAKECLAKLANRHGAGKTPSILAKVARCCNERPYPFRKSLPSWVHCVSGLNRSYDAATAPEQRGLALTFS